MKKILLFLSSAALWAAAPVSSQLYAPNETGVAMAQWHTIVRDVDATKKFWMLFGGKPIKVDGDEVIKFQGVLIFLQPGTPSGGTQGTTLEHIGFMVPNGQELTLQLKAAGVKVDPGHFGSKLPGGTGWGYVYSPDDVKVEILDNVEALKNNDLMAPIAIDHTHYMLPEAEGLAAQAWYAKFFGLKVVQENTMQKTTAGMLPGNVKLRFGKVPAMLPLNKGRALDYIGFEVKDLEAFCKKLEAAGVKLDEPYSRSRHKSFASARLTDQWGTSLELTEGLSKF